MYPDPEERAFLSLWLFTIFNVTVNSCNGSFSFHNLKLLSGPIRNWQGGHAHCAKNCGYRSSHAVCFPALSFMGTREKALAQRRARFTMLLCYEARIVSQVRSNSGKEELLSLCHLKRNNQIRCHSVKEDRGKNQWKQLPCMTSVSSAVCRLKILWVFLPIASKHSCEQSYRVSTEFSKNLQACAYWLLKDYTPK